MADPLDSVDGLTSAIDVSKSEFVAEMKALPRVFADADAVRTFDLSGRTRIMVGDDFYKKDTESTDEDDGDDVIVDDGGNHWLKIAGTGGGGGDGSYSDEQAQDAVGSILVDSSEIDFTYSDSTPSITASIKAASIDESKLDTSVNASLDLADGAVQANSAVTGATKTKITYDAKGLVTAGADATQDDIGDGTTYKQYSATDKAKLAGISGTNTGDQTTITGNAGTATKLATARAIDGQSFDGSAAITVIAPGTHAATGKTTPDDADELALVDSAASNVLKKVTWANVKATLKTYFDTLYSAAGAIAASVLTTRGDLLYRDASAPARLAKGSANALLTQGTNDPTWAKISSLTGEASPAAGDFILLERAEGDLRKVDIGDLPGGGGGGGADAFTDLTDTFSDYTGHALEFVRINAAEDGLEPATPAGGGDMLESTYDPNGVEADAFSQDNMVDGTTNKNYTATEKTKLAGIESNATGDQTASEILTLVKTVDGSGSGLDADTIDGHDTSYFLSTDNHTDGTTNKVYSATEKTKLAGIASSADVTSATNVASVLHAATGKTTPVDADELGLIDSAASNVLKKLTWANLKATLKTYLDTLYVPLARTVNSKALSSNITLGFSDIAAGALASGTTATTQSANDNSTKLATTAYADAAGSGGGVTAGDGITVTSGVVSLDTNNVLGIGSIVNARMSSGTTNSGSTSAGSAVREVTFGGSDGGAASINVSGSGLSGTWRNISSQSVTVGRNGLWIRTA